MWLCGHFEHENANDHGRKDSQWDEEEKEKEYEGDMLTNNVHCHAVDWHVSS